MSNKAMAYVWDTDLNGATKLMLLAIADRCDEFGMCFPGVEHLAEKCGIKKRAAQKLLTKLEELGELVVIVAGGTKTISGHTNRYFMKKFRDTLDIETPEVEARGVQTDIPQKEQGVSKRTSDGVSKVTPDGVSKRTSNPKGDTKGDTSATQAKPKTKIIPDGMYEAVQDVFGIHGGLNVDYQKFLSGIATKKQYKPYNMANVVTPDELRAWSKWYRRTVLSGDGSLSMVLSAAKIQSSIMEYRLSANTAKQPVPDDVMAQQDAAEKRMLELLTRKAGA